ncbi:MAG: Type fimbrial biosis protein PilY1 [Myxococcaceae bacterium]|nr:Type fimbrial biosis protein PilY1 [Myxococcaceae bacterium]
MRPFLALMLLATLAAGCNCGGSRLRGVPPGTEPMKVPELDPEPEPYEPPDAGVGFVDAGQPPVIVDAGQPPVVDAGTPDAGVIADPTGCADGTREGFTSKTAHPRIAGCSGAWSIGGVTRSNMAPTCGRVAGNTSPNVEGNGCAAVDLCATGWHVCRGKEEVAIAAPGGCGDAVPIGAPDKSLFFAVAQHSVNNSTCDSAGSGDNDVFGCGNLGTALQADKQCAPLTRALASVSANSCGFNEAEPTLGPWKCVGAADSHLHEGAIVTKIGCPGRSCSYDGQSVGSSDKGGVLCCRD